MASLWCCKDLICLTLADEDTHGKLVDAVAGVEVGVSGKAIAIAFKVKAAAFSQLGDIICVLL